MKTRNRNYSIKIEPTVDAFVNQTKMSSLQSDVILSRGNAFCSQAGCYSFLTALGIGFIAWTSTHLYVCFCAPSGFWGFVQSLVVMDSTFCHIVMGLIHHTQSLYGAMMIGFLFSAISVLGKGVAWMTGGKEGEVPTSIQSRPLKRV
jgi:hypothetical protein